MLQSTLPIDAILTVISSLDIGTAILLQLSKYLLQ